MARRRSRLTAVLVTSAAGLLLAGCGSTDSSGSASSATSGSAAPAPTSDATSSAPTTDTPAPEAAAFCAQGQQVFGELNAAFDAAGSSGPSALPSLLDQTVAAFDQVQPPPSLTADWQAVRSGVAGLRDEVKTIDLSAPDAQSKVQAALDQAQTAIGEPFQRIGAYTDANCPETSSSPTS